MSSLVSAVITTHRRPQSVCDALDSVCAETYPDLECIVVDDAGTFRLPPWTAGRRVRVVHSNGGGVARARNAGLAAAAGTFIIFLDDDDIAYPVRITALVDAATRHDSDLAFGRTRRVSPRSAEVLPDIPTGIVPQDHVGLCDLLTCTPHVNSVLVRTSALRDAGGFDENAPHFDDWSAWLRLADRKARISSIRRVVAEWRLHDEGLSARVQEARAMQARILALFDQLSTQLSHEGAGAIAIASAEVRRANIQSYDDYATVMEAAQRNLHAAGRCLGPHQQSHASRRRARGATTLTA